MSLHAILTAAAPGMRMQDCLGYFAAGLVFATFSVASMRALRCIAVLSNIAFIAYAATAHLPPILLLHALLLPTNLFRLMQNELRHRSTVLRRRVFPVSPGAPGIGAAGE